MCYHYKKYLEIFAANLRTSIQSKNSSIISRYSNPRPITLYGINNCDTIKARSSPLLLHLILRLRLKVARLMPFVELA